ncbi:hypothetical protein HK104_010109 [Borealophlyctis nickersoniae]|nr:hypothetical protein HK104_010109 [Borealophlyctis nickersoniae]
MLAAPITPKRRKHKQPTPVTHHRNAYVDEEEDDEDVVFWGTPTEKELRLRALDSEFSRRETLVLPTPSPVPAAPSSRIPRFTRNHRKQQEEKENQERKAREELERKRAAVRIQTWYRCVSATRKFRRLRTAAIRLQALARGQIARARYREKLRRKKAAIRIQTWYRSLSAARKYHCLRKAAIQLQAVVRGQIARSKCRERRTNILLIQRWIRTCVHRRLFLRQRQAAVFIQAWYRAHVARICFLQQRQSAIRIQSLFRGCIGRSLARTRLFRVVFLQRCWKRIFGRRRDDAATRIQACVRCWLASRHYKLVRGSAQTIQAYWMGRKQRARFVEPGGYAGLVEGFSGTKRLSKVEHERGEDSDMVENEDGEKQIPELSGQRGDFTTLVANRDSEATIPTNALELREDRKLVENGVSKKKISNGTRRLPCAPTMVEDDCRQTHLRAKEVQCGFAATHLANDGSPMELQADESERRAYPTMVEDAQKDFRLKRSSVVTLQRWWREISAHKKYVAKVALIQNAWRVVLAKRELEYRVLERQCKRELAATVVLQRWWRIVRCGVVRGEIRKGKKGKSKKGAGGKASKQKRKIAEELENLRRKRMELEQQLQSSDPDHASSILGLSPKSLDNLTEMNKDRNAGYKCNIMFTPAPLGAVRAPSPTAKLRERMEAGGKRDFETMDDEAVGDDDEEEASENGDVRRGRVKWRKLLTEVREFGGTPGLFQGGVGEAPAASAHQRSEPSKEPLKPLRPAVRKNPQNFPVIRTPELKKTPVVVMALPPPPIEIVPAPVSTIPSAIATPPETPVRATRVKRPRSAAAASEAPPVPAPPMSPGRGIAGLPGPSRSTRAAGMSGIGASAAPATPVRIPVRATRQTAAQQPGEDGVVIATPVKAGRVTRAGRGGIGTGGKPQRVVGKR